MTDEDGLTSEVFPSLKVERTNVGFEVVDFVTDPL